MTTQLQLDQQAPEGIALDIAGAEVALSTLWQKQPILLTFLRHFG